MKKQKTRLTDPISILLDKLRRTNNDFDKIQLLHDIGIEYQTRGDFGNALMYHNKEYSICQKLKSPEKISIALREICDCLLHLISNNPQHHYLKKWLGQLNRYTQVFYNTTKPLIDNKLLHVEACSFCARYSYHPYHKSLNNAKYLLENCPEAERYYKEALQMIEEIPVSDKVDELKGNILVNLAEVYIALEQFEKAEDCINEAEQIYTEIEYNPGIVIIHYRRIELLEAQGNIEEAITLGYKYQRHYQFNNKYEEAADLYNKVSLLEFDKYKECDSMASIKQHFKKFKDVFVKVRKYTEEHLKDDKKRLEIVETNVKYAEEIFKKISLAASLSTKKLKGEEELKNLEEIYKIYELIDLHSMNYYYAEQVVTLAEQLGNQKSKIDAMHSIANIYFTKEEYDTAIQKFESLLSECRKSGTKEQLFACLIDFANVLVDVLIYPNKCRRKFVTIGSQRFTILEMLGRLVEEATPYKKEGISLNIFEQARYCFIKKNLDKSMSPNKRRRSIDAIEEEHQNKRRKIEDGAWTQQALSSSYNVTIHVQDVPIKLPLNVDLHHLTNLEYDPNLVKTAKLMMDIILKRNEKINLSGKNLTAQDVEKFIYSLDEQHLNLITEMNFSRNSIKEILHTFSYLSPKFKSLQTLDLEEIGLNLHDFKKLSSSNLSNLLHLNISRNVLTDECAEYFSKLIQNCPKLESLDVCMTNMGIECAKCIIQIAPKLKKLNIAGNTEMSKQLIPILENLISSSIEELDISGVVSNLNYEKLINVLETTGMQNQLYQILIFTRGKPRFIQNRRRIVAKY